MTEQKVDLSNVKDLGKDPMSFEYNSFGEYFIAKGYLPVNELTEDFISKITYKDYHKQHDDGTVFGIVRGLRPKVKVVETSLKEVIEGKPNPKQTITYREEPICYWIGQEEESGNFYIEIVGGDKYAVELAAERIIGRLR